MNDETIAKLQDVFAPVAAKIGQGAQFGWEIVLRQQQVYAVGGLIAFIFGLIGILCIYKFVKFALKKDEESRSYGDWKFAAGLVGVIGGVGSIAAIVSGLTVAVTHFLNPAYYAIAFFISLVK